MNTQEVRVVPRGNRRRKAVIDLNAVPGDQEGTSASSVRAPTTVPPVVEPQPVPTPIDVDAIEDDVIESSASAFAEAKSKSRNARRRSLMVDVESGGTTRVPANLSNKRRRIPSSEPIIDCEHASVNVVEVDMLSRLSGSKAPAPPPEEPKFTCPICMCAFTEEMSTKCGHIFCKGCIKMAITRQGKCPTCRKKVTAKELIRVFLPATR
ncbi:PREDICTED: LON peptidase N-terminal domain and RING finger protein 3-like [Camelina sativa]|uniref:LON peptidase N-terminal domain and RING finger protein 3-like n=1 Tax=Camelina sativa TaxID=90675 RepID=A0ABM0Y0N9_CAMSA|nr:PREDICTED: LON peptidase N-terminal domain and RING finger protein 3-like [Camelina sativa]XP_010493703.1 PREDICTED: LON peptidase N-terminal domain and RING finger protein 3-like [Camelina sativa]